jgi:hypothetical protein
MTTLTLAGVVFQGFEIPETINFGGAQMLAVHKLPGGQRVLNPMGPDDDPITWSGRFRGSSAEQRALLLNSLRRQGNQVLLTWNIHRYQVVIKEFKADFQQAYEIPYSITCEVVIDELQALASAVTGFLDSIAADVINANGLSSVIGNQTITTAVNGVVTAASNLQAGVPVTTTAIAGAAAVTEGPLLNTLQNSIGSASSAVQTQINATPVNTTPVTAGGSPSIMANALSSTTAALGQLTNLYQLGSVLGRMSTNTANASN